MRTLLSTGGVLVHFLTTILRRVLTGTRAPGRRPPLVSGRRVLMDRATGTLHVGGLGRAEAEDLLDWLEAGGGSRAEVSPAGARFRVRWSPATLPHRG